MLFYAVPILKSYLPSDYIHHLVILVFAIHKLLSANVEIDELSKVQKLLQLFYSLVPELYGEEMCTANVHSLIHLVKFVKLLVPIWTHSSFGFENMNGILKRQMHGTRTVLLQIVFMMKMQRSLSLHRTEESSSPEIEKHIHIVGKVYKKHFSPIYALVLGKESAQISAKLKIKNIIYHSEEHERSGALRSNSIISYSEDGIICFADIVPFATGNQPVALIEKFSVMKGGILDDLEPPELPILNESTSLLDNIIFKVKKLSVSKELTAIPVTSILSKCVLIPVKGLEWNYIIVQVEHH